MSIRRSLLQVVSSFVILTILFSGFSLPSASAQRNDDLARQFNAQTNKVSFTRPVNGRALSVSGRDRSSTFQDPNPTPAPTETSLPTETPDVVLTPAPTIEEAEAQEGASKLDALASNAVPLASATWYVATTGSDSNSCSTSASPCLTIHGALGKATAGDTIKVAIGTYTSTSRFDSEVVLITKNIILLGGWDVGFTTQADYSTIDGQNLVSDIYIKNSPAVTINRFIVKQGHGYDGGGIRSWNSTVNLDHMLSFNNFYGSGGGISNSGVMTITNSLIYGNKASYGGGIYVESDSIT